MSRKTQLPAVPPINPADPASVGRAHEAVKELLEVAHGRRGDPQDRFVTLRELQDAGLATVSRTGQLVGGAGAGVGGGPGGQVFDPGPPDFGETDFTVPPAPTGVDARGVGADGMIITWNPPGYRNHAYAEIFEVPIPDSFRRTPRADITPTPQSTLQQAAPAFVWSRPVSQANRHPLSVGFADGVVFLRRNLSRAAPTLGNPVDDALFPPAFRYFVRFVSTAKVAGPLAPVPQGATGVLTVDPGSVLDAMVVNATNTAVYRDLRRVIDLTGLSQADQQLLASQGSLVRFALAKDAALRQEIVRLTGDPDDWDLTNETLSSVSVQNRENLRSLWTVRMNQTVGGAVYAAGFGLGLETNATTGQSLSTFAISANQFVVSGPTTPFFKVVGVAREVFNPNVMTVTLAGPSGLAVGTQMSFTAGDFPGPEFQVIRQLAGMGGRVASVAGAFVSLFRESPWPAVTVGIELATRAGLCIVGDQSIPFIIDTLRNVVGIRGSLIVDGLVRSQVGDFDNLVARSAFVDHLRGQTVDANVVVGQRIIAGTPAALATGQIDDAALAQLSNYIVELANPVRGVPFRYYQPRNAQGVPHVVAELDQAGNFRIGGNLEVGRNAVINTTDGTHLLSIGGVGADTGPHSYQLWIGPRSGYGAGGAGRTEADAILAVRSDGRVTFNAEVFLGGDPLTIPTSTGVIDVQAPRGGGPARVFLSAHVGIAPPTGESKALYDVYLGLISTSYTGRGVGTLRPGIGPTAQGPNGEVTGVAALTLLAQHCEIVNTDPVPSVPGGFQIAARSQVDANTGTSDLKNISVQGSLLVNPGLYKVFVSILKKLPGSTTAAHAVYYGSFFAIQTQR